MRQEEGMCCIQYTLCDFLDGLATGNADDQPSWALGKVNIQLRKYSVLIMNHFQMLRDLQPLQSTQAPTALTIFLVGSMTLF